jgi:hypothetical protein
MARTRKKKGKTLSVNFKGVEGKQSTIPADDYAVKVDEVTEEEGQNHPYLKWVFVITDGDFEGRKLYLNTSLSPNALWNLRGLLESLGQEVPDDEMDIDLEELVGSECVVTTDTEKYEGRMRSIIVDFVSSDEAGSKDEEEDDEPKSKKGKSSKKGKRDEEEEEEDEDEKPSRSKKRRAANDDDDEDEPKSKKKSRRSRDEEEEEEDDDAVEDRRASKSKAGKKSKKAKGVTVDELEDASESDLEEFIEEHNLDIDLGKAKTLTKKRNLVQDALEEADLLIAA